MQKHLLKEGRAVRLTTAFLTPHFSLSQKPSSLLGHSPQTQAHFSLTRLAGEQSLTALEWAKTPAQDHRGQVRNFWRSLPVGGIASGTGAMLLDHQPWALGALPFRLFFTELKAFGVFGLGGRYQAEPHQPSVPASGIPRQINSRDREFRMADD